MAKSFQTASHTGVTADAPAHDTPAPPPPTPAASVPAYVASLQASTPTGEGGSRRTVQVADLMPGAPPPERDLVTITVRVPRFVKSALYAQAVVEQRDQQEIVIGALGRGLDPELVNEAYEKAKRQHDAR